MYFFLLCNLPKLDCPVMFGNKVFLANKKIVIALSLEKKEEKSINKSDLIFCFKVPLNI